MLPLELNTYLKEAENTQAVKSPIIPGKNPSLSFTKYGTILKKTQNVRGFLLR